MERLYNDKIIGFVEINDDFLTSFGYTLEGRLPETFNEVIITKYILLLVLIQTLKRHTIYMYMIAILV